MSMTTAHRPWRALASLGWALVRSSPGAPGIASRPKLFPSIRFDLLFLGNFQFCCMNKSGCLFICLVMFLLLMVTVNIHVFSENCSEKMFNYLFPSIHIVADVNSMILNKYESIITLLPLDVLFLGCFSFLAKINLDYSLPFCCVLFL